jgi:hypothetical protein
LLTNASRYWLVCGRFELREPGVGLRQKLDLDRVGDVKGEPRMERMANEVDGLIPLVGDDAADVGDFAGLSLEKPDAGRICPQAHLGDERHRFSERCDPVAFHAR